MPTSPYSHLVHYVDFLLDIKPESLLDIGLGNGKLGFVARDLLDVMFGERYRRSEWQLKLDGIEVFSEYIQDHQKSIYNDIFIGDAFHVIDGLGAYDLVVMGDVLEHFPKEKGLAMLDKCFAHATKAVILFVPLGGGWEQPAIYGNTYERHLSVWEQNEFESVSKFFYIFEYKNVGCYGAFLIEKQAYLDRRIEALKTSAFFPKNVQKANDIRSRYDLSRQEIGKIDLNGLSRHCDHHEYRGYFLDRTFKEHYRLLAHLSYQFSDKTLFDVGTLKGYSALALSANPRNRVISYDIEDLKQLRHAGELTTIDYQIGNVLEDPGVLSAPLVLLDTYHDGTFENTFYNHLKQNRFKGLLVLDDIHLNHQMEDFWQQIDLPKEDVTDLGHWSGTGVVDFSHT